MDRRLRSQDGLNDLRHIHVYCEEQLAEAQVLRVDGVHVVHSVDEGWDVNLVEIEAPDTVKISFDADERVDAEIGRGLDVFPGHHGDILAGEAEIY